MGTYELWRAVMYGVGVFVTCNAGGAALRLAVRRLAPGREKRVVAGVKLDAAEAKEFLSALMSDLSGADEPADAPKARPDGRTPGGWTPQTFADMRRQCGDEDAQERQSAEAGTPDKRTETPDKRTETPDELLYGVNTPEFAKA